MQHPSRYLGRKLSLAAFDLLLVNGAFVASFIIRFGIDLQNFRSNLEAYLRILPAVSVCSLLSIYLSGLYSNWLRKSRSFLVHSAVASAGIIVLAAIVLSFWERAFAVPRTIFLLAFPILATLLGSSRLLCQWLHKSYMGGQRRVLVIASDVAATSALTRKFVETHGWYRVHRYLQTGQLASLPALLPEVDTIAIGEGFADQNHVVSLCMQAGKEVLLVPAIAQLLLFSSRTQQVDDLLMFSVEPPTLSGPQKAIKRAMDVAFAGLLFLLVSPLLLLVGCLIRLDSKGPAIYRQERVGQKGKLFHIFKFRTMKVDAESHSGPVLASEQDPRITRVGRFLRASRIDELPQLLNVLLGDMSFVGPRPERAFFVEQFERETPGYRLRLNVKPGITGLAQVWGKYSTEVKDKLRLDLMYIANYSPLLDITIMIQTFRVVLLRQQAKGIKEPSLVKLPSERLWSELRS